MIEDNAVEGSLLDPGNKEKKKSVTIRLDEKVLASLKAAAKENNLSLAATVRKILEALFIPETKRDEVEPLPGVMSYENMLDIDSLMSPFVDENGYKKLRDIMKAAWYFSQEAAAPIKQSPPQTLDDLHRQFATVSALSYTEGLLYGWKYGTPTEIYRLLRWREIGEE